MLVLGRLGENIDQIRSEAPTGRLTVAQVNSIGDNTLWFWSCFMTRGSCRDMNPDNILTGGGGRSWADLTGGGGRGQT